jgi:DNA topoisomerase-1
MQVQATRPGSDRDTKANVKAYGATTLEARHVVETKEGVRLQFIGKEGIWHDHLIRDKELGKMLLDRKNAAKSANDKLFNTTYDDVHRFTVQRDGGKFTPKDFRTSAATSLAVETVQANPQPAKDEKEYKARMKEVAVKVSSLLGNKPAQALKSYIAPFVFAPWSPK